MSGDDRPVRPGIVETQGEQALTKRVDVIRETIRGLHQGQQPCGAARTGRTHGCTRPVLINAKNLLHRGGRPHMASDSRILDTYLGAGAVHPITSPVENIWQFMRDNWLSNRVFNSYDNIVDHCREAWNKLIDQPWRIMSIGRRNWARGS